jgi:hypothetical protein
VTVARAAVAIVAVLLAGCLAACSPSSDDTSVQVASGTLGGNAWVARAGLAGASGICLEIQLDGGGHPERICGLQEGESGLWRFDVPGGTFVAGTTDNAAAASAHLVLADGSEQTIAIAGAGEVTSIRFFVLAVPPGPGLDRLEIIDAAGVVIENRPVG